MFNKKVANPSNDNISNLSRLLSDCEITCLSSNTKSSGITSDLESSRLPTYDEFVTKRTPPPAAASIKILGNNQLLV
jgi:hypothetical protein